MGSLLDRLQNELDDRSQDGGITAMDLVDLPPSLQNLMRLLLRKIKMDYESILEAAHAMPQKDRLDKDELDQALNELNKKSWLIRKKKGDSVFYKVNLRRKASRTDSGTIWSMLDDKNSK